jgi:hypothetical protein
MDVPAISNLRDQQSFDNHLYMQTELIKNLVISMKSLHQKVEILEHYLIRRDFDEKNNPLTTPAPVLGIAASEPVSDLCITRSQPPPEYVAPVSTVATKTTPLKRSSSKSIIRK